MSEAVLSPATDPAVFAEVVLGEPMWDYQAEFARSRARVRVVNAGRQVGKSRTVAKVCLFEAATRRNILVLVLSAGETASRRLLQDMADLATRSDLFKGSVVTEFKSELALSNGSRIISIPASEKQARGWPADVLVVDEAAFVSNEVWESVEPTVIARPGSRIIITSSPFSRDHWFARTWELGRNGADPALYASFHWPSSLSPLVDKAWLDEKRRTSNPLAFSREYEARFTDSETALLSPEELDGAVMDYEMVHPRHALEDHGYMRTRVVWGESSSAWTAPPVAAGVDWGMRRDANAIVLLGVVDDGARNDPDSFVFFVPWLEQHFGLAYADFIARIAAAAEGYHLRSVVSESNGVGAFPSATLAEDLERATARGRAALNDGYGPSVTTVWTDNRRKMQGYGRIKGMIQSRQLVLPRVPELLQELASLEVTLTAAGNTKIEVPETRGHDDLADALMQAVSALATTRRDPQQDYHVTRRRPPERWVTLPNGLEVPEAPRLLDTDPYRGFGILRGSMGDNPQFGGSW